MSSLLSAVFFASGASALIFETLWFRQTGLAFGNSIWASSLVLSAFMAGLALGNAGAAWAGARDRGSVGLRRPIRAYAIAEAVIATTGVALVYGLPHLGAVLAPVFRPLLDHPWELNPLRLLVAFLLLLIPSTAMGITLPLLTEALSRGEGSFGGVLGALYGWNTLGAVAGALLGEMFLMGRFGVRGTALVAAGLNAFAAVVASILSASESEYGDEATQAVESPHHGTPTPKRPRPSTPTPKPSTPTRTGRWVAAAFLAGFCLLALEVVWFRFLLLFVKGSSNAFPVMLAVVLAGIALGGLAASLWLRATSSAPRFAAAVALTAGIATVASYAAFPSAIAPFGLTSITQPAAILRISIPLMFPVSFVSGVFFPLAGAALRAGVPSDVEAAGVLTLANTTGAAVGSLVAGFLLLPMLGIEKSVFAIALAYGLVGALAAGRARTVTVTAAVTCAIALAIFPFGQLNGRLISIPVARWAEGEPERRLVAVREGLTETIVFFQRMLLGRSVSDVMLTNSFSMSTTGYGVRRYQKLYVWWPVAVHPSLKHALLIGYGVGNTAKALTDTASLESIDLVDLSSDILSMAAVVFPDPREQPLRDPRMHVHIEDGRYFLQTTDRRFDLITGEPPPPGIAGVETLYSREYFQLMRDRLADNGVVTYWLPLSDLSDASARSILRAFCDVFADCSLWNGSGMNLMMVGFHSSTSLGTEVSEQQFRAQWSTPRVAAEMKRLGLEHAEQLGALFIGDAAFVRSLVDAAPPLTDNEPKRIDAPFSSQTAGASLLAAMTDTNAARARFESSTLIRQLWPASIASASLPFFDVQHVIDAHMYGSLIPQRLALEDVDELLSAPPGAATRTPVLWRLGSNSDIQAVVAHADTAQLMNPVLQYHLAIRLLSERRYADAAEAFERATAEPRVRDNAFVLYVYALCLSGQRQAAQEIASSAFAASGATSLPPLWVWMRERCGIDPMRSGNVEK